MEPYVSITATVQDRWGNVEDVYAGSMPAWAWGDTGHRDAWRKAYRKNILQDRTGDPRGWRVSFAAALLEESA